MTSTLKNHENRETVEEQIVTTVLPPIITTSYNSPLAYPIYTQAEISRETYIRGSRTQPQRSPPRETQYYLENISRIERVPFQRKKKGYQTKEIIERVPVEKTIIQYEAVKKINYVPKQKVITDYYVIQHQTAYIPRNIEQKVIDYVPIQTYSQRIEYKPVEKQVVHYPQDYNPVKQGKITSHYHSAVTGSHASQAKVLTIPSVSSNSHIINQEVSYSQVNESKPITEKPTEHVQKRQIINIKDNSESVDNLSDDVSNQQIQIINKNEQNKQSGSVKQSNLENFNQSIKIVNNSLQESQKQIGSSLNFSAGALPQIGVMPLIQRDFPVGASNYLQQGSFQSSIQSSFGNNGMLTYPTHASFSQALGQVNQNIQSFSNSNGGSFNNQSYSQSPNNFLAASNQSFGFNPSLHPNIPHFQPTISTQPTIIRHGTVPTRNPQINTQVLNPHFMSIQNSIPTSNQIGSFIPSNQPNRQLFSHNLSNEQQQSYDQYQSDEQEENSVQNSDEESSQVQNR